MSKVPSLPYERVILALRRDGWVVVRQKGSHIRLQKQTATGTLKLTVPAHRPILRSTLSHILKQAQMTLDQLNRLLCCTRGHHSGQDQWCVEVVDGLNPHGNVCPRQ